MNRPLFERRMRSKDIILVIFAAFLLSFMGCDNEERAGTPEEAVRGMFEAVKDKDYVRAVGYIDVGGIVTMAKKRLEEAMKNIPEEGKDALKEEIEHLSADNIRSELLKKLEDDKDETGFTYKILETKDGEGESKIVVVEVTEKDKEPEKREIPVVKTDGVWKVTISREETD